MFKHLKVIALFSAVALSAGSPVNVLAAPVKPVAATAVQDNDAKAAEKLTRKLEKIRTISAKFKQESVGSDGRIRTESGSMQIKRPGKFRWDTASPFEQEIVALDKKIWLVDRDLQQVIIQIQDQRMSNTPAQLLSGDVKEFLKDYQIGLYRDDKQERFTLTPAGSSDLFEKLDIIFRDGVLNSIELRDSLGGRRRVELSDVNVNGMISDSDFRVEIPKGYDVIDQTGNTEQ
ncbi:outer membrane lipoprotein chaperone LolA [Endozoicomonas lisbonensis]